MKISDFFGHLKNIITHKFWVVVYGRKLGCSWWRLLMHDMSKFSKEEFVESVIFYRGNASPIPYCKSIKGYSMAWQHHKGRNKHHYEYWTDNYDAGTTTIPIPLDYVIEMMADWMAAGRTYMGKGFSIENQKNWWENKKKESFKIHPATFSLIDDFYAQKEFSWDYFKREEVRNNYITLILSHMMNKDGRA